MDVELLYQLLKVKGAINYSGDASMQVLLPTEDGKYLRVGVTDDDVAEVKGIWFDYYEGLNGEIDKLKTNFFFKYLGKVYTSGEIVDKHKYRLQKSKEERDEREHNSI